jgi:hypothetical protein
MKPMTPEEIDEVLSRSCLHPSLIGPKDAPVHFTVGESMMLTWNGARTLHFLGKVPDQRIVQMAWALKDRVPGVAPERMVAALDAHFDVLATAIGYGWMAPGQELKPITGADIYRKIETE